MAQQPKNNIGNLMIISPKREKSKKTSHPFIRAASSNAHPEANSVEKQLKNYWGGSQAPEYKVFTMSEVLTYCPSDDPEAHGMMIFKIEEADIQSKNVSQISTEPFDEDKWNELTDDTSTYRFVLEGQYLWRRNNSAFSANGFGHIRDNDGPATHILATLGQEKRGGDTWYHLILRAGNVKNGKVAIIEDYEGGGGEPPGAGNEVPPTI